MSLLRSHVSTPAPSYLDAFARLRVSNPVLILESKQVGNTPGLNATTRITGSGSSVYSTDRASTALSVGPAGGTAIRQTRARAVYQPGKSLMVLATFIMAADQPELSQRVGYFDENNGVFFQKTGSVKSMTIRSNVNGATERSVPQSLWNVDRLDGTGPSGVTLRETSPNILLIDLEWLGVGRVRTGFVIDGLPVYCHEFMNANQADIDSVYMTNPNLPVRWEAEAAAALDTAATLEAICCVVNSEGGYEVTGITAAASSPLAGISIPQGQSVEVLAIRTQAAFREFSTAFVQSLSTLTTTTGNYRWSLVLNPTATAAGSWAPVPSSVLESNSTRTVTANTGFVLNTGFVSSNINAVDIEGRPVLTLGSGVDFSSDTDVVSLQIHNMMNQADTFFGAMTWREVY